MNETAAVNEFGGLYVWLSSNGEWHVGEDGTTLCDCGWTQGGLDTAQRIVKALGGDPARVLVGKVKIGEVDR